MIKLVLTLCAKAIIKINYSISISGIENIKKNETLLYLPHHISYLDAVWITGYIEPKIYFLIYKDYFYSKIIGFFPRVFGAIPISRTRAKDALIKSIETLKNHRSICIYPEGMLTHTGVMNPLQKGMLLILKKSKVRGIPVFSSGLWGSYFSKKDTQHKFKLRNLWRKKIFIHVGKPIDFENNSIEKIDSAIRKTSCLVFKEHAKYLSKKFNFDLFLSLLPNPFKKIINYKTQSYNLSIRISQFYSMFFTNKKCKALAVFNLCMCFEKSKRNNTFRELLKIQQTNLLSNFNESNVEIEANSEFWHNSYSPILIYWLTIFEKKSLSIIEDNECDKKLAKVKIGSFEFNILIIKDLEIIKKDVFTKLHLPTGLLSEKDGFISLPLPEPNIKENAERFDESFYEKNTFGKLLNGVDPEIINNYNLKKNEKNLIIPCS